MSNYEKKVKDSAEKFLDMPIANSTMEHAFIAFKYLINKANKEIRVVSGCFYEGFWKDLEPCIKRYLSKPESSFDVIIVNEGEYNNKGVLNRLKNLFPDRIKVYKFNNKKLIKKAPNFLTIDNKGYRYEYSDEKKKEKLVEGVINFGDQKNTKALNSLFESLEKNSSLLPWFKKEDA